MRRTFAEIFLLIFPTTALLFGVLIYFLMRLEALGSGGLLIAVGLGIATGVTFGVGIGYFARGMDIAFPIDPSVDIYTRLQLILLEMGYRLDNQFQKVMTFAPTVRAGLFADRIRVEFKAGQVHMEGPRYHLERLQARLGL